jgi:hypothetical protein
MAALSVGICVWSACAWAHHTCIPNHVGKGHSYMRTLFIHSYGSVRPQRCMQLTAEDEIESNWAMIWFLPRSDRECMLPREKMWEAREQKQSACRYLEKGGKPLIKVMYWTSSSWLKLQHKSILRKATCCTCESHNPVLFNLPWTLILGLHSISFHLQIYFHASGDGSLFWTFYGCILLLNLLQPSFSLSLSLSLSLSCSYRNDIWFLINRHYYCR